ncbi:putative secreted protein (Por secretion system target) [Winogradskyella pacifica]|uniref:Putative secreted protein (Por secretion system target) n=1 Tax=Winogradskyella pacifica TaxID=664642 RepID=A0A3D9N0E3_9FLAO|nr:T9SS type A sorting domain-containing protein [Winogradskyella pacifica]REE24996.1 putative secreted protein (Por secretion system target) [Winogradskyella pacifica]
MKLFYLTAMAVAFCYTTKAQDLSSTLHVSAGTTVTVSSGTKISTEEVNLKSTSDSFACLFLNGDLDASTVVNYDRYVNVIGISGENGGNDLISLPVKTVADATFADFLTYTDGLNANLTIIPNSPSLPTLFAFGPYNNTNQSYTNYNSVTDAGVILKRGVGYRAASYSGQTVRFTGTVSKVSETVEISTTNNAWNSIGNPYPTFIDSQAFLSANSAVLDPNAVAIYAYNNGADTDIGAGTFGNFTIINGLTETVVNIAPGQAFLVANDPADPTNIISFTTAMRTYEGTDDFILGRATNQNQMLRLQVENGTDDFATEIYYNANSTLGLDPGYDAILYNGVGYNLLVYSHLVENNLGKNMAIQSLGFDNQNDVSIPLGLKAAQGQQITFSIEASTLPSEIEVYLEDTQANTFTLLNTNTYSVTTNTAISGTGRFYLRVENSSLSTIDLISESLQIVASEQTLFINGALLADTEVLIYDIQGRLVMSSLLKEASDRNIIDAASLSQGIYVVKLNNEEQQQIKKVIFK